MKTGEYKGSSEQSSEVLRNSLRSPIFLATELRGSEPSIRLRSDAIHTKKCVRRSSLVEITLLEQRVVLEVMKHSPKLIGLAQAFGLVLYIIVFVLTARTGIEFLKTHVNTPPEEPVLPMIAFLLAFVTSALICGTIAFGYPTYLFLREKKEEAVYAVLWTVFWLIVSIATGVVIFALYSGFLL